MEHCIFYKSINWIRCFHPLLSFVDELYLQCGRRCWMFEAFMAVSCTHCKITGKIDSLRTLNLWRQLILPISHTRCTYKSFKYTYFFFSAWMSRNLSNMYCVCVWNFCPKPIFNTISVVSSHILFKMHDKMEL